jgi:iron complex outermembrane recepter protein
MGEFVMPVPRQDRFGTLVATSLIVSMVSAQSSAAQTATPDEVRGPGEIVVTAQKRAQSVQDVPISITAVGAEELQRRGVQSVSDVAKNVPGLKLQAIFGDSTNPNFFLRGIGLLDFGDVAETPVGFYQDEVYLATQASQGLQLFDIERVEVLKGPQGTLYGRNTTGGVVNIVTAEPGTSFGGQASAQVGSFGQTIVEAAAGGPVVDKVGVRLAVKLNRDNGFQRSASTGIGGFGQTSTIAARGKIKFDLGAGSDLLLIGAYSHANQRSPLYPLFGLLEADLTTLCSQEQAATGACFNQIGERFIDNPRRGFSEDTNPRSKLDQYGATARLRFGLGGWATLTSVTGYQDVEKTYQDDADASSIPLLSAIYGLKARQWS